MGQPLRVGADFQVNTLTIYGQHSPDAARLPGGGFVVVWLNHPSSNFMDVRGQRFSSVGSALGSEFVVSAYTTGFKSAPAVSADPLGGFLVVWAGFDADGDQTDIYTQRYDGAGVPVGTHFLVNADTTGWQVLPDVGHDVAGRYVVSWQTDQCVPACNLGRPDLVAQRFDVTDSKVGGEIVVAGAGAAGPQAVAVGDAGGFLLAWQRGTGNSSPADALAQVYDSTGTAVGTVIALDDDPSVSAWAVDAAATPNGYLVAYSAFPWGESWYESDAYVQRIDSVGQLVGTEIVASTYATSASLDTRVTAAAGGRFIVSWSGLSPQSGGFGIHARRFDAAASPDADAFVVSDYLAGSLSNGVPIIDDAGSGVVVFQESSQFNSAVPSRDGSRAGIFARRFCDVDDPACDRCPDGDEEPDTDGDGVADDCDLCTNVGGGADITLTALVSTRSDPSAEIPVKSNKVRIKAEWVLGGGGFAALDPIAEGARLRLETWFGGEIVAVSLPAAAAAGRGTAGWKLNGAGTTWKFVDRTGVPANGIAKMIVRDRSKAGAGRVQVKIKGNGGLYPSKANYTPLEAIISLGDRTAATAGRCGETIFSPGDCVADLRTTRCKR